MQSSAARRGGRRFVLLASLLTCLALLGCGATIAEVVSTPALADDDEAPLEFTPAHGEPCVVAEGRYVMGGLRIEARGDAFEFGDDPQLIAYTHAVQTRFGWVFMLADQTVWRADTFLGPLESLGRAPEGAELRGAVGMLLVRGGDLRLYRTLGRGPLEPLESLEDYGVRGAYFQSPLRGVVVEAGGVLLETRDGGASFEPIEDAERRLWAQRAARSLGWAPRETRAQLIAATIARYPGLASAVSGLAQVGDEWVWYSPGQPPVHGLVRDGRFTLLSLPAGRCESIGPLLVRCSSEDWTRTSTWIYATEEARWRLLTSVNRDDVPDSEEDHIFSSIHAQSSEALLFQGACERGEPGSCWVDRRTGAAHEVELSTTELELLGVQGYRLVFWDKAQGLLYRDLRTGVAEPSQLFVEGDLPEDGIRRALLLDDGNIVAIVQRAGDTHRAGAHRSNGVHVLTLPMGVSEVTMASPTFGIARLPDEPGAGHRQMAIIRDGQLSERFDANTMWRVGCRHGGCTVGPVTIRPELPTTLPPMPPERRNARPDELSCRVLSRGNAARIGDAMFERLDWDAQGLTAEWRFDSGPLHRAEGTMSGDERFVVSVSRSLLVGFGWPEIFMSVAHDEQLRLLPHIDRRGARADFGAALDGGGMLLALPGNGQMHVDHIGVVRLGADGTVVARVDMESNALLIDAQGAIGAAFTTPAGDRFALVTERGQRESRTLSLRGAPPCHGRQPGSETWWYDRGPRVNIQGLTTEVGRHGPNGGRNARYQVAPDSVCLLGINANYTSSAETTFALTAQADGHMHGWIGTDEVDCVMQAPSEDAP